MITKGNRRAGLPILIHQNNATYLERIPLEAKLFKEAWLQDYISRFPHILPISEIEPAFSPAISVGREVPTGGGYIDNLLISPGGYLTIVETKLWRNPEARRAVVGQILDYAQELSRWNYEDLELKLKKQRGFTGSLWDLVCNQASLDPIDEADFIDSVNRNLKHGRFLLLLVGDGIRENVEDMINYLSHTPQLHFTLGLIELQVFRLEAQSDSLLVIPQLITRTREIARTIFRVEGGTPAVSKAVSSIISENVSYQAATYSQSMPTLTEQDFFDQLQIRADAKHIEVVKQLIKDSLELGLVVDFNSTGFTVKLPDPEGSGITLGILIYEGFRNVYLPETVKDYARLNLPLELVHSFAADTVAMLPNNMQHEQPHKWKRYCRFVDLIPIYNRFVSRLSQYVFQVRQAKNDSRNT